MPLAPSLGNGVHFARLLPLAGNSAVAIRPDSARYCHSMRRTDYSHVLASRLICSTNREARLVGCGRLYVVVCRIQQQRVWTLLSMSDQIISHIRFLSWVGRASHAAKPIHRQQPRYAESHA